MGRLPGRNFNALLQVNQASESQAREMDWIGGGSATKEIPTKSVGPDDDEAGFMPAVRDGGCTKAERRANGQKLTGEEKLGSQRHGKLSEG